MEKLDTLQKIEISEGVEITLRVAGPAARGIAWMMDTIFLAIILSIAEQVVGVFVLITTEVTGDSDFGQGVATGLYSLFLFIWTWFYFTLMEYSRWGATLGKKIMGLRVVRTSGAPLSLDATLIRNVLRVVDCGLLCLPGLISCLMTKHFQRLGDLVAGTLVIYSDSVPTYIRTSPPNLTIPVRPAYPLSREEQGAIVKFSDRMTEWSEPRKQELANHVQPLTKAVGPSGVQRLMQIAQWIRSSE